MGVRTIVSAGALLGFAASHAMAQTHPPSAAETATVVVNAKTPPVVHKTDRTVYNLQDNAVAVTGSVSDVLATLPSVYVDPRGGVSVRGAPVQIYIDGKPAPAFRGANLATALKAMPANTVAQIEVITNPGPEFRSDAHTVINLVTRKSHGQSATGEVIVSAGSDARYNQTLLGSFGVGKWTFSGNIALRQYRYAYTEHAQRDSLDTSGSPVSQLLDNQAASRHQDATTLNGAATYSATDRDTLSLAVDIVSRFGEKRVNDAYAVADPLLAAPVDIDTLSNGPEHFINQSLTATYKHKDRAGGDFTLQAKHEEDDNLQDFRYDQINEIPASPDTLYRRTNYERYLIDGLTGDYARSLSTDTEFKSGFDVESNRGQFYNLGGNIDSATGAETLDPAFTQRFLADDRLAAAYVQYQAPVGKWLVQGGLRVENMLTRFTNARVSTYNRVADTFLSPSLFASRNLTTDSKIKFSYTRHITRPSSHWLDPTPETIDAYDVFEGNPNLKPSSEDSYEANYNYTAKPFSLDATAYYRNTAHDITEYLYPQSPTNNQIVWSYENAGRNQRDGLDLSLDFHPSKAFGITLSSDIYATSMAAPFEGLIVHQSIGSYLTMGTLTWQGTPADNLQLTYGVAGRQLVAEGTQSGAQWQVLSYSHTLSTKLKIVATAADVLNNSKSIETLRTPQFQEASSAFFPGPFITVGLDYKFGAGK